MRAPDFWRRAGGLATALGPLSALWIGGAALRRSLARPWRAPVPVLCIGNLTVGGGGKTPLAMAVAAALAAGGRQPHILSHGYGGRLSGPVRVDPERHRAAEVGDEPLLLARCAPTWIARDRAAAAHAAVAAGADSLVLDDGLQNASLAKDLSLLVIDGGYGFGNGRVMPAGPLREPLAAGLARVDAAVLIGADRCGVASALPATLPLLRARTIPAAGVDGLAGQPVYAFAGIARPAKFYETLVELGCTLSGTRDFPDHHRFSEDEIASVVGEALRRGAIPVTTEKDAVRLPADARALVRTLPVVLEWEMADALDRLLAPVLRGSARDG